MASCSDLNRTECRPITKATPVPISTSKKLVEPFNRLKNRANIFRRKNYSSQLSINTHSNNHSLSIDQTVPSHRIVREHHPQAGVILLKRSNSMICPQQRLQTYLNQNNNNNNNNNNYLSHRNSICFELAGCSTDESSTDDYQLPRSTTTTANHYWTKSICSSMTDIDEHESLSVNEPSTVIEESTINPISEYEEDEEEAEKDSSSSLLLNPNKPSEQEATVILPSTMDVILREKAGEEKQQEQISSSSATTTTTTTTTLLPTSIISSSHSSSSSSASTVILRDHAETIRTRRQCHSSISLLQHQQQHPSFSSSIEEPFYDCKQSTSPKKSTVDFNMPTTTTTTTTATTKISACTMTGKSLNNLDECSSSEEKAVQTCSTEPFNANTCVKRAISSASLTSSSSASIQTDSSEKKSKTPITTTDETTSTAEIPLSNHLIQTELHYRWPHIHERLLGEQACIYWVNYLGSTAIKMSNDGTTALPTQAIARLKQSTQYARVLPIIGLNISSRGVEFLKHTKDRVVICFHDIKSIHCACQDQDLRYFAYVTREHRLTNGISHGQSTNNPTTASHENKEGGPSPSPSPSLSLTGDYHHYCHVFVVKSEAMSTEIMLTFGQVFDIAYRLHRRLKTNGKKSKDIHSPLGSMINGERHPQLEVIRLSTKSDITPHPHLLMSSSTHSPATSSSSSSMDERKVFV